MARRTPELLQYLGKQDHQKLFQVLTRLSRFGMGRKFTRAIWRMEDSTIKAHPCYWTITRVVPNKVVAKSAVCVARPNGLDLGTQDCGRFILGCKYKIEGMQVCHHIITRSYAIILRGKTDSFYSFCQFSLTTSCLRFIKKFLDSMIMKNIHIIWHLGLAY